MFSLLVLLLCLISRFLALLTRIRRRSMVICRLRLMVLMLTMMLIVLGFAVVDVKSIYRVEAKAIYSGEVDGSRVADADLGVSSGDMSEGLEG